ncbi:MAG: sugar phosphate isomerase/epimerase family protein [Pirellulales bacterium]
MSNLCNRRQLLGKAGLAAGAAMSAGATLTLADESQSPAGAPFRYCLNTSTIRGQSLSLVEEIEIAAKAGYDGIEPWMREVDAYVDGGGSLADLRKRLDDRGLTVESAIGFAEWIVDDDAQRARGLEAAKRDMDRLRQIGGLRIAAPPAGAQRQGGLDLFSIAQRYRVLLELGQTMDVVPQVEVWGFSQTLGRLGEVVFVAVESGHDQACVLPDVYHIYKGGSDFTGLKLLGGAAMHVFHVNDYPAAPAREALNDGHRVYPGDGVAPLPSILRNLRDSGFRGALSLELFNQDYWSQDALAVARTGLEKTKAAVAMSLEG